MAQTLPAIFYRGSNQERVDYTPGGALACGDVVDMGSIIGIVTSPEGIAASKLGSLATRGTFKLLKVPADNVAHAVIGASVFWNTSLLKVVAAAGANVILAGRVEEVSVNADDHVKCAINELPVQEWGTTTTTT